MRYIKVVIITDDSSSSIVDEWECSDVPRVGDYLVAKISYRLVTRVVWIDSHYVRLFVSNILQGVEE